MTDANPTPQPASTRRPQPFARWNPTRGCWETSQLDLFGLWAPFSAIWPISGEMRDGLAYQRHWSPHRITDSESSFLPTAKALFRTPLASDSSRGGEPLDRVRARRGTIALSHQIIDFALHGPSGSPDRSNDSETLFALIETIFTDGDSTPMRSAGGNISPDDRRRLPQS